VKKKELKRQFNLVCELLEIRDMEVKKLHDLVIKNKVGLPFFDEAKKGMMFETRKDEELYGECFQDEDDRVETSITFSESGLFTPEDILAIRERMKAKKLSDKEVEEPSTDFSDVIGRSVKFKIKPISKETMEELDKSFETFIRMLSFS